jgi:hypothetical protein
MRRYRDTSRLIGRFQFVGKICARKILGLIPEDLDDIGKDAAFRGRRSMESCDKNPLYGKVQTVGTGGRRDDMAENTLNEVERLVDQLSLQEQARLLASLALRMVHTVERGSRESGTVTECADAWAELFRVGDALLAEDKPDLQTLTSAVTSMRR